MSLWQRLMCAIGRHRYRLIQRVTPQVDHARCTCCGREIALHNELRAVVPWSSVSASYAEEYGYQADQIFCLREGKR